MEYQQVQFKFGTASQPLSSIGNVQTTPRILDAYCGNTERDGMNETLVEGLYTKVEVR